MSLDAMKQALEYIRPGAIVPVTPETVKILVDALRLAIEQAERVKRAEEAFAAASDEMKGEQAERQEPVAWMTINAYGEEDDIHYEDPKGGLPEGWTYLPLYTHPPKAKQPQDEPLGYWNAVQGWVELPEEAHKPTAWVYPEALEAFQKGQPWTAYGTDGKSQNSDGVERIPLYTAPPQRQPLTEAEIFDAENSVPDSAVSDRDWCVHFARAIERAHGIGEDK